MEKIKTPFQLAGLSIGMGLVGEAFNSEGLKSGGQAAGKFISPSVNILAGGLVINQLNKYRKILKRKEDNNNEWKKK
jgi:hypothetical protein